MAFLIAFLWNPYWRQHITLTPIISTSTISTIVEDNTEDPFLTWHDCSVSFTTLSYKQDSHFYTSLSTASILYFVCIYLWEMLKGTLFSSEHSQCPPWHTEQARRWKRVCHWESLPWLVKSSVPCLRHSLQNRLVTGKQNCQASRQEVFVEESQLIGEYQTKVWNPQGQIRAVFLKYLWSLWSFYMVILYAHLWKCTHTHAHTHTIFTKHTYHFHLLLFFLKNTTLLAHVCGDSESINVRWSI